MKRGEGSSGRVYAGVDVGTQSLRVVVVDDGGAPIGRGEAPLHSARCEGGRHEQDPEEWWRALGVAAAAVAIAFKAPPLVVVVVAAAVTAAARALG
jgi:sugar (pentulose or hexulose) kinase